MSLRFFHNIAAEGFQLRLFSPDAKISLQGAGCIICMYIAEFMDHLIDVLIRQRNPLGLTYTGSFPYKLLILLRFHRISAKLPDGIIIKKQSSH